MITINICQRRNSLSKILKTEMNILACFIIKPIQHFYDEFMQYVEDKPMCFGSLFKINRAFIFTIELFYIAYLPNLLKNV
jgi:hypothetical protein